MLREAARLQAEARAQAVAEGRAEGQAEGRAESRAEDLEAGALVGKVELLQGLLHHEATPRAELEAMPLEALEALAERLQQQLAG